MNDRGEKIVELARELLRSEFGPARQESLSKQKPSRTGLKTLFMTALLAAFGSSAVTHAFDELRRPINRVERVELDALFYYVARERGINEEKFRRDTLAKFGLSSGNASLTTSQFFRLRGYLHDQSR